MEKEYIGVVHGYLLEEYDYIIMQKWLMYRKRLAILLYKMDTLKIKDRPCNTLTKILNFMLGCNHHYDQLVIRYEYRQLKKDLKKEISFWKNKKDITSFTKKYYLPAITKTPSLFKKTKSNENMYLSIESISQQLGKYMIDKDLERLLETKKQYSKVFTVS